jgi:hypothetical protein
MAANGVRELAEAHCRRDAFGRDDEDKRGGGVDRLADFRPELFAREEPFDVNPRSQTALLDVFAQLPDK